MGNVLEKVKQEQVIALGRLSWSLRRIEAATGVRRETMAGYLVDPEKVIFRHIEVEYFDLPGL